MKYEKAYNQHATVVRFRDGDTVEVFIECDCCGSARREAVRLPKIDSWEIASHEKAKALRAAELLTNQYRGQRGPFTLRTDRRDKYGRLIGDIIFEGKTLSLLIVEQGLAWYGVGEPEPNPPGLRNK